MEKYFSGKSTEYTKEFRSKSHFKEVNSWSATRLPVSLLWRMLSNTMSELCLTEVHVCPRGASSLSIPLTLTWVDGLPVIHISTNHLGITSACNSSSFTRLAVAHPSLPVLLVSWRIEDTMKAVQKCRREWHNYTHQVEKERKDKLVLYTILTLCSVFMLSFILPCCWMWIYSFMPV